MTDEIQSEEIRAEKYRRRSLINNLQVPPKDRTPKINNQISSLLQGQPFFKEFANNYRLLTELAQRLEHFSFSEGQYIYRLKQPASHCFVIIEGTIQLTLPQQQEVKPLESNSSLSNNSLRQEPQNIVIQPAPELPRIIKILEAGESFGEIVGERGLRTTNAVAFQNCNLLGINKKTYEVLLKAQLRTQHRGKYLFLSGLSIFQHMRQFVIESLALLFEEEELKYGQVLFHEGEQLKYIYLVFGGQFRLLRSVNKHSFCGIMRKNKQKSEYYCHPLPQKEVSFAIVNLGQLLGNPDSFFQPGFHSETCVCESETAKVLAIDRKLYFKTVGKEGRFQDMRRTLQSGWKKRKVVAQSFFKRRSQPSPMNSILNSNQWDAKPKKFRFDSSCRLTSEEIMQNQHFFLNQLNRTLEPNSQLNRFSHHQRKCKTQTDARPSLLRLPSPNPVPSCVRDIVGMVRLKSRFAQRFRRLRKKQKNIFRFDAGDVPIFIKKKFNRMEQSRNAII